MQHAAFGVGNAPVEYVHISLRPVQAVAKVIFHLIYSAFPKPPQQQPPRLYSIGLVRQSYIHTPMYVMYMFTHLRSDACMVEGGCRLCPSVLIATIKIIIYICTPIDWIIPKIHDRNWKPLEILIIMKVRNHWCVGVRSNCSKNKAARNVTLSRSRLVVRPLSEPPMISDNRQAGTVDAARWVTKLLLNLRFLCTATPSVKGYRSSGVAEIPAHTQNPKGIQSIEMGTQAYCCILEMYS